MSVCERRRCYNELKPVYLDIARSAPDSNLGLDEWEARACSDPN
jgi:hypothetical protein